MRWLLLILLLAVASPIAAAPPLPPILGFWQGDTVYLQITQPGCLQLLGNGIEVAIPLPNGCNVQSYQLHQNDPDPQLRPWGRVVVLMDSETHLEVVRWVVPSRRALWIPLVQGTTPQLLQVQAASIAAAWQADVLQVEVTPPDSCLTLIGNLRPSQWIGCGETHYTLAPGGVDQGRVPMNRTLLLTDYHTGVELARLRAPPRIVRWMPLMDAP